MQRDALSRPDAEAILGAQIDRATRRNAADDVIDNGGTLDTTRAQVVVLHERYSAMGRDCPSPRGRAE
jgi:dephospho-CoA kinase